MIVQTPLTYEMPTNVLFLMSCNMGADERNLLLFSEYIMQKGISNRFFRIHDFYLPYHHYVHI